MRRIRTIDVTRHQHKHTELWGSHKRRINKTALQRGKNQKITPESKTRTRKQKNRAETSVQLIIYAQGVQTLVPFIPPGPTATPPPPKKTALFQSSGKIFCTSVEPICSYQKIKKNVPAEVANKWGSIAGEAGGGGWCIWGWGSSAYVTWGAVVRMRLTVNSERWVN